MTFQKCIVYDPPIVQQAFCVVTKQSNLAQSVLVHLQGGRFLRVKPCTSESPVGKISFFPTTLLLIVKLARLFSSWPVEMSAGQPSLCPTEAVLLSRVLRVNLPRAVADLVTVGELVFRITCLLYTSPSPRD